MEMQMGNYRLNFSNGGIEIIKDDKILYYNHFPISVTVKTRYAISEFYECAYEHIKQEEGKIICEGEILTPTGSKFGFCDVYTVENRDVKVSRKVKVLEEGTDLGFSSKYSLVMTQSQEVADYDCFCPGMWYEQNRFAPDSVVGKDLDCEYFWQMETRMGLPVFSMLNRLSGESIALSRWSADMTLRNVDIARSESNVDEKMTTGAIGMSKPDSRTLNYLYYGFAVRTESKTKPQGLAIDYVYPGCDGQYSQGMRYSGLDFKEKPMNFRRINHPVKKGFEQNYAVGIYTEKYADFQKMMREVWRHTYDRLRDELFEVDNEVYYHDCMKLLDTYTKQYGDSYGLPFACQLPDMDVSSVSFQFGFVGQQPGIGLLLLQYGLREKKKDIYEKGMKVIDFWVRKSMTETGLPKMCYHPALDDFEPYPYYIRMLADGVEAILEAYYFMKKNGVEKTEWLTYCRKAADWVVSVQEEDGSFCHAYNADGTVRMADKGITPSIIRFLVQMYSMTKKEDYKSAAIKAGNWSFVHIYREVGYRGGTCDNATITDKESGIYAMFGFTALYDLTQDEKWLEAAIGAADYTETWTYAWKFPVVTSWTKHPFNQYSISGQSIITIIGGADVYMAACAFAYYRLYLLTEDVHYLDFAEFVSKNTRQSNDVDGSTGYIMRAVGHESGDFSEQILRSQYHWLPWCTFVQTEPTSRFYDVFGCYEISEAQKMSSEERKNRIFRYDCRFE